MARDGKTHPQHLRGPRLGYTLVELSCDLEVSPEDERDTGFSKSQGRAASEVSSGQKGSG